MRSPGSTATIAILAITVAACTGNERAKQSVGAPHGSVATTGTRDYLITATDYAYTDLPVHAPSGWVTLRLANRGSEQHMLGVLAIPTGYTPATIVDSLVRQHIPPEVKGWAGVDVVSPGDTAVIAAYFAPGEYAVGCFVKSPDGALHVVKGMAGAFDVIAAPDTGSAPQSDAVARMSGTNVELTGAPLKSGRRTLRVLSDGPHFRDFQLLKLLPGRSSEDALKWYANRATVAPAATAIGGVSGMYSGQKAAMTVNFTPGSYVMLFDIQDAHGHPGFAHRTFVVPAQ